MTTAAVVQGAVGMGFTLVCVPLLSIAVGPSEAVGTAALLALVAEAAVVVRQRADVDVAVVRDHLVGAGLAVPVGLLLVAVLPPGALVLLGGSVVLVGAGSLAVCEVRPSVLAVPDRRAVRCAAGFTAGVLGVSTGMSGPPVALERAVRPAPPDRVRATLALFFVVTDMAIVLVRPAALSLSGVVGLALLAITGTSVGRCVAKAVSARALRGALIVVVAVSGLAAVAHEVL